MARKAGAAAGPPAGGGKGGSRGGASARRKKPGAAAAGRPPSNPVRTLRVAGQTLYEQDMSFMEAEDPAGVDDPFTLMPGGGDRAAADLIGAAGALITMGDHKGARRIYKAILAQFPNHYMANYNMGVDCRLAGRPRSGIKYFTRAIMVWPDYHMAYAGLGHALLDLKQYDAALEALDKALEIQPDYPLALRDRAEALRKLGGTGGGRRGRMRP